MHCHHFSNIHHLCLVLSVNMLTPLTVGTLAALDPQHFSLAPPLPLIPLHATAFLFLYYVKHVHLFSKVQKGKQEYVVAIIKKKKGKLLIYLCSTLFQAFVEEGCLSTFSRSLCPFELVLTVLYCSSQVRLSSMLITKYFIFLTLKNLHWN